MKKSKIFRPQDLVDLTSQQSRKIDIFVQRFDEPEKPIEVYEGPSPDEIRAEIQALKEQWETERVVQEEELQNNLNQQRSEVDNQRQEILAQAQASAEEQVQRAQSEAERIIAQAENRAAEMINDAELKVNSIHERAKNEGIEEGREKGYEAGFAEVRRLSAQLHYMISGVLQRRDEIIASLETDLIDLTLLIARKVVKVLSENQKDIVIYNTLEALKKMRSRGTVTLRVSPDDFDVTTKNKELFVAEVERLEGIHVVEDHTVQRGGCIVETEFGEIDARISSQLREVEDKILSLKPVRRKTLGHLSDDIVRQDEEDFRSFSDSLNLSEQASTPPQT